ncbi:MAG TPA: hypothetical protein VMM15_03615, partial [Bradyrhizobium sp.]|nr:hypothetical protein [Bradyrhizobium sp.]
RAAEERVISRKAPAMRALWQAAGSLHSAPTARVSCQSRNGALALRADFNVLRHGRACPGHARLACRGTRGVDASDKRGRDEFNKVMTHGDP